MNKVYSSLKDNLFCVEVLGQPNIYRQATADDIESSRKCHEEGYCDCNKRHDRTLGGIWYDEATFLYDLRKCGICHGLVELI